jgi:hypothetical protein
MHADSIPRRHSIIVLCIDDTMLPKHVSSSITTGHDAAFSSFHCPNCNLKKKLLHLKDSERYANVVSVWQLGFES